MKRTMELLFSGHHKPIEHAVFPDRQVQAKVKQRVNRAIGACH